MSTKEKFLEDFDVIDDLEKRLIVWNDEVHTFDFVIDALMKICEHSYEQASQCTLLIHHKGKCDVRRGSTEELKPMKDQLIALDLGVTIE